MTAQKDARRPLSYRHYSRRLLSYIEPRLGRNGRVGRVTGVPVGVVVVVVE